MNDTNTTDAPSRDDADEGVALADVDIIGPESTESCKLNGPPGCGKTTQCAARIADLIENHDIDPVRDITWVTYRESLARDTVKKLLDWKVIDERDADRVLEQVNTLHSISMRHAGSSLRQKSVVTKEDKFYFCRKLDIPFGGKSRRAWDKTAGELMFSVLDWLVQNNRPPEDAYITPAWDEFTQEWPNHPDIRNLRDAWEQYKHIEGLIDFHEMLSVALDADEVPPLEVFVVDEMHDAYPLFMDVVNKWAEHAETIIAAGDPNQVVNGFDGADPSYFREFPLQEVLLDINWRVPRNHWLVATSLLELSHEVPPVSEFATEHGPIYDWYSPEFEYDDELEEWTTLPEPTERGSPVWIHDHTQDDDILYQVRTRKQMDGVAQCLKHAGILFNSQKFGGGWNTAQKVRLPLYNALQKLAPLGPELFDVQDFSDFEDNLTNDLDTRADDSSIDPREVTLKSEEIAVLIEHAHDSVLKDSEQKNVFKTAIKAEDTRTVQYIAPYVKQDFWRVYCRGVASVDDLVGVSPDTVRTIKQAMDNPANGYIGSVVQDINARVQTIHASKGAEARTVVLYDGITRTIDERMDEDKATQDNERRTWFVGLTRSSQNLIILRDAFDWTTSILPAIGNDTR